MLLAMVAAQPALAQAAVVKCTITSGDAGSVIPGGPGSSAIYKIGDGKWLQWLGTRWFDRCGGLGRLSKDQASAGGTVSGGCSLSATVFAVSLTSRADSDLMMASITIDRTNGQMRIQDYASRTREDPGYAYQAAGICGPTMEPVLPAPPLPPKAIF